MVARSLAPLVRDAVRATDLLGTGAPGEVFLLLGGAGPEDGLAVARRLMQAAACLPGLELNVGVASSRPHSTFAANSARAALLDAMASARLAGGGQILVVEVGVGARRENLS